MTQRVHKVFANLLNDYHLFSFDELDSTNEEAKRLAKNGGANGAVVWAKRQTAGKGRLGREWVSSEGNLFVSVLLDPNKPLAELSQLSFVAAVAVVDALAPLFEKQDVVQCKWPNDILLEGKKLGGILLESFQTENREHPWVVVGVGVNVDSFPSNAQFPATCLTDAGVELVSAKIILSRFVHHFIERYNSWNVKGFGHIRKSWVDYAWGLNEPITARLADGSVQGKNQGIDAQGNLLLKLKSGKMQSIQAADVFPLEKAEV